jgi:hypothetical protein
VSEIDTLTAAVATSVEQQSLATDEIARAISRASDSSSSSSKNIAAVAAVVGETNSEAGRVTATTGLLSDSARTLAATVNAFLRDLTIDIQNRRLAIRSRSKEGVTMIGQSGTLKTTLIDISDTGAKMVAVEGMRDGDRFIMEFEDATRTAARRYGSRMDLPAFNSTSRSARSPTNKRHKGLQSAVPVSSEQVGVSEYAPCVKPRAVSSGGRAIPRHGHSRRCRAG